MNREKDNISESYYACTEEPSKTIAQVWNQTKAIVYVFLVM